MKTINHFRLMSYDNLADMVAKQDEAWVKLREKETEKKNDFKERTESAEKIADEKLAPFLWMVPEEHRESFKDIFKSSIISAIEENGIGIEDLDDI